MSIAVSTQLYDAGQIGRLWPLLEQAADESVGVEIFPEFQLTRFEPVLQKELPRLIRRPITFHGPYWGVDPCFLPPEPEFEVYMKYWRKTLDYAARLQAQYVVYHLYNTHFAAHERQEKRRAALETMPYVQQLAEEYGVLLAIENTETSRCEEENLLTQQEFVDLVCARPGCGVLIDTGHVACAGWDMPELIHALSDRIVGYHLHNNNGREDSHHRIGEGVLDMEQFARTARECTPDAVFTLEYNPRLGITEEEVRADIAWLKSRGLG